MRGKLGSPCKEPRCAAIVEGRERYCEKHRKLAFEYGFQTGHTEVLPMYSTQRWQALRKLKLAQNPICEVCNSKFAQQVHHLKKAREFPELAYHMDNLQSICVWCHAKETQRETTEKRILNRQGQQGDK
jgi:5-methylcytosine-specific restriction protein A